MLQRQQGSLRAGAPRGHGRGLGEEAKEAARDKGGADLTLMQKGSDTHLRAHYWSFANREGLMWSVGVLMLREGLEGPGRRPHY